MNRKKFLFWIAFAPTFAIAVVLTILSTVFIHFVAATSAFLEACSYFEEWCFDTRQYRPDGFWGLEQTLWQRVKEAYVEEIER